MARLKFIRVFSQVSRQKERDFLGWYLGLIERFSLDGRLSYSEEVEILSSPSEVRGYAELREEKMSQAEEKVESIIQASRKKAIA